ncbi:MAG: hypothetical protein WC615_01320 [Mucilaginibacter sp.]|jgi:hypothetical protein|uniref:hypothetical protein n=1 Tax=Mucilaginibacter sp. TaxID=1882438 RepID=UPI0035638CBD
MKSGGDSIIVPAARHYVNSIINIFLTFNFFKMNKDSLKEDLLKRELVKPNSTEERLAQEVESLCETFDCTGNLARANGDIGSENDILF